MRDIRQHPITPEEIINALEHVVIWNEKRMSEGGPIGNIEDTVFIMLLEYAKAHALTISEFMKVLFAPIDPARRSDCHDAPLYKSGPYPDEEQRDRRGWACLNCGRLVEKVEKT